MSNYVFPTLNTVGWSVFKTPNWLTKVQIATSGKELRSAWFSAPKYNFKLTYEVLRADSVNIELQTLLGFFNARQGSFDSFLFTDPLDNAVTAQNFGTGNGTITTFMLGRSFGGVCEYTMNINGAPQIYVGGVLKTLTTDYTIDAYGNVTFVTAPSGALTWTGSYYYRCRFVKDSADFENFMYQLWTLKELEFIGSLGNKV